MNNYILTNTIVSLEILYCYACYKKDIINSSDKIILNNK